MFQQAQVPVLGIIENMSYHVCECCGERTHVFGKGGGARIAASYDVPFLGEIPLVRAVREAGDSGRPVVCTEPGGPVAAAFTSVAERIGLVMPVEEAGHA